jgi:amino acid transporter
VTEPISSGTPGRGVFFGFALTVALGITCALTPSLLSATSEGRWIRLHGFRIIPAALPYGVAPAALLVSVAYVGAGYRRALLGHGPSRRSVWRCAALLMFVGAVFGSATYVLVTQFHGSLDRFAHRTELHGTVMQKCCGVGSNRFYDVNISRPMRNLKPMGASTFEGYCDMRATCLHINSEIRDIDEHDTVTIFVLRSGEVFLQREIWTNLDVLGTFVFIAIWLSLAVFFLWALRDTWDAIHRELSPSRRRLLAELDDHAAI